MACICILLSNKNKSRPNETVTMIMSKNSNNFKKLFGSNINLTTISNMNTPSMVKLPNSHIFSNISKNNCKLSILF